MELYEDRRNPEFVAICVSTAVIYEYVCVIMSNYANVDVIRVYKIIMRK